MMPVLFLWKETFSDIITSKKNILSSISACLYFFNLFNLLLSENITNFAPAKLIILPNYENLF